MIYSDQISSIYNAIAGYLGLVKARIDLGGEIPLVSTIGESLGFEEIATEVLNRNRDSASHPVGAMIEACTLPAAISREHGIRLKSKSEYYSDQVANLDLESIEAKSLGAQLSSMSLNIKEGSS